MSQERGIVEKAVIYKSVIIRREIGIADTGVDHQEIPVSREGPETGMDETLRIRTTQGVEDGTMGRLKGIQEIRKWNGEIGLEIGVSTLWQYAVEFYDQRMQT